jgi:hypothetical protein
MSTALKKSPLSRVKDEFGGKDKLVDKIVGVLDSGDESKDDLRKRLLGVANKKLIRLFTVASETKQAGGHDKLAASAADKLNRGKDKDYVEKLGTLSNGRLLDIVRVADGRTASASAKAAAAGGEAKAKAPRAAKPAAKAAPKSSDKAAAKAKTSAKASKSAKRK